MKRLSVCVEGEEVETEVSERTVARMIQFQHEYGISLNDQVKSALCLEEGVLSEELICRFLDNPCLQNPPQNPC